jgi:hypothetical protein
MGGLSGLGGNLKKLNSLSPLPSVFHRRLSGHMQTTPPPPKDCPSPLDQNPKASPLSTTPIIRTRFLISHTFRSPLCIYYFSPLCF